MGSGMENLNSKPASKTESTDPGSLEGATSSKLGDAISTDGIKAKLLNLKEHMPEANDLTLSFGKLLAERLNNEEIVPMGFNMAAELLLYDLQTGVNGFTGQKINSSLVGYPSMTYTLIRMDIPTIAAATCPPDFAKGVLDMQDAVNNNLK